jgi:hypothetical protein
MTIPQQERTLYVLIQKSHLSPKMTVLADARGQPIMSPFFFELENKLQEFINKFGPIHQAVYVEFTGIRGPTTAEEVTHENV